MKETKQDIIIGTNVVGQPIYITKYEIDSEKPGKVIYIQGGIHGGEVTLHIIRNIYDFVKKNIVSGKVVFVPFVNPMGWQQKAYAYTVGKFSNKTGEDFNRTFGKKVTDSSMTAISNKILDICSNVDLCIDLHTAHTSLPHTITFCENDLEIAKKANIKFNRLCFNSAEYEKTLDANLCKKGISSFTIECGSHDDINYDNERVISNGILNVIKNFNVIKSGLEECKTKQFSFSKAHSYFAECGGVVDFKKNLGESFKNGDVLFTIKPANLQEKEHVIKAEFDGIVFRFAKTHIFDSFDEVMRVFKLEELTNI